MLKLALFSFAYLLILIVIVNFQNPDIALAIEDSSEDYLSQCTITTINDPLILGEEFELNARNEEVKFTKDLYPYRATITYGIPYIEKDLGSMKLAPDTNDDNPECKCVERDPDTGSCEKEIKTDPCDQENSRNLTAGENIPVNEQACSDDNQVCEQGNQKFSFSDYIGPIILSIYDKNNRLVCYKYSTVEPETSISVDVLEPIKGGDKVTISGFLYDRGIGVKGKDIEIKLNGRIVETSTDELGSFIYNFDTTEIWGLKTGLVYTAEASTTINSSLVQGSDDFTLVDPSNKSFVSLGEGVSPLLTLIRYYNPQSKDYLSLTSLPNQTPPSGYRAEGSLGELLTEDDGSGSLAPLYDCIGEGADHYNSTNLNECEKNGPAILLGYLYKTEVINSQALYLCQNPQGEKKLSLGLDCREKEDIPTDYIPINPTGTSPVVSQVLGIFNLAQEIAGTLPATTQPLGYTQTTPVNCTPPPVQGGSQITANNSDDQSKAVTNWLQNQYPKEIKEQTENDPNNKCAVYTGVTLNLWGKITGFVCNITGALCPQPVVLGEGGGTFRFRNQTNVLNNASSPNFDTNSKNRDAASKDFDDDKNTYTGVQSEVDLYYGLATNSGYFSKDKPLNQFKDLDGYIKEYEQSKANYGGIVPDDQIHNSIDAMKCLDAESTYPKGVYPQHYSCQ